MYTDILIRFAELSTKGRNKMIFVRKLKKNIKSLIGTKPEVEYDRIFMEYSKDNMEGLKYIFGVHSWSPVIKTESNLESIKKTVLALIKDLDVDTFKVDVNRHWKDFPIPSMELNRILGNTIIKNKDIKVNLKNPKVKIEIEVREKNTYVFLERHMGLGGHPTGVNGRILHLISGGIDSPVAALEMMKRGIAVDFLNFVTPPHTDQRTLKKVDKIIEHLMKFQGETRLYRSHYTDIMNLIGLTSNQSYKITLMRRSFYRIASKIAQDNNYLGISNGENLGQVASQTLESMAVIQEESSLPIYRPLLTRDKIETINQAIKLGTYKLSIEKAKESCEIFAPKLPAIKPMSRFAKKLEDELNNLFELEDENIKNQIKLVSIKNKA